jgi:hypothetical protein
MRRKRLQYTAEMKARQMSGKRLEEKIKKTRQKSRSVEEERVKRHD